MNLGNPIAKGNTAAIYLFENKIIKVFNDSLPDSESIKEADKQRFAYSCGLPVPEILDVTQIDGKQAIIMEYIEGETLGNLVLKDKDQAEYYMNISVDLKRKIHSIKPDPEAIEPMEEKLYRQIETLEQLNKKQKHDLLKKVDAITYEKKFCHGDFHLFNLIQVDQRVTVIDWVDSTSGDLHADVYRTYLLYSLVSAELAEMYLRLYCEKSGILKSAVFKWAPIIAGASLSENASTDDTEQLMKIINQSERF